MPSRREPKLGKPETYLTDEEFIARLNREVEISLRDHPERWRWRVAGGVGFGMRQRSETGRHAARDNGKVEKEAG